MSSQESPQAGRVRSELIVHQDDLEFGMSANGFYRNGRGWSFNPETLRAMSNQFEGLPVSFYGPRSLFEKSEPFFVGESMSPDLFAKLFNQPQVIETIGKYRRLDSHLANRVSYLIGGVARQIDGDDRHSRHLLSSTEYAARLIKLGDAKSGDALAAAISFHAASGGSTKEDRDFDGLVYRMGESVSEDPVIPRKTEDLGISQVARLRHFMDLRDGIPPRRFPNLESQLKSLEGFPTVGAEFHLPLESAGESGTLWKRLALLNTSQYQRGSSIQFSRSDQGIIEIRMNPSVYPVTIANWEYLRRIVPEINNSFFTMTFNRTGSKENFTWENPNDEILLKQLTGLGLLTYALLYDFAPPLPEDEEIDFGKSYLGQTVRLDSGGYDFRGNWGGGRGQTGQLGIYAGFGRNFPYLAYYPSMALANPNLMAPYASDLSGIRSVDQVVQIPDSRVKKVFLSLNNVIANNMRLKIAGQVGDEIIDELKP